MSIRRSLLALWLAIAWLAMTCLAGTTHAETRIGLVITNQSYKQAGAALANTHRDGDLVKVALEKVGFRVWTVRDTANEGALLAAIGEHVARLAKAGPDAVGFLYYSGHGAADRSNGENYLIPTDAPLTHVSQLPLMAVRLEKITAALTSAGRMSFVVFDACRNVALQREGKDLGFKGFAPVREQNGLLVAFATDPGNVAIDQSLYARALADEMVKPGLEAAQVFRRVRQKVREESRQTQSPEFLDKRENDFHFAALAAAFTAPPAPAATRGDGHVASIAPPQPSLARCGGIEIETAGAGKRCVNPKDTFEDCFTSKGKRVCGPKMVVIAPGKFLMGTPEAEIEALIKEYPTINADWIRWEGPEHEVTIAKAFSVGETHVTRGQFAAFVAATGHATDGGCSAFDGKEVTNKPDKSWRDPGFDQDDSHPVVCINWHDAHAYAEWLSKSTGHRYRLMTEAEAEFVARGTTTSPRQPRYSFGNDQKDLCIYGNGADQAAAQVVHWSAVATCRDGYAYTAPSGRFAANPFGVKDVHGNAWTWIEDCFIENYRDAPSDGSARTVTGCATHVVRGGSWLDIGMTLRSAFRNRSSPTLRSFFVGLRVARTLDR